MCASTMTRGPCVPCVAMIDPRPSKVSVADSGFIRSTRTLRIGSSNPGGPAASVSCCSRVTVRSCAITGSAERVAIRRVSANREGLIPGNPTSQLTEFTNTHPTARRRAGYHHDKMLEPGTRLGRYAIRSLIGVGGMGEVYLADDTSLGRSVAIKTLPHDIAADPDRVMRFEREARLLASLSHPHIAAVVGFEEAPVTGSGQSLRYLVLEHIDGPTLEDRLAAGPLSIREALAIAHQIALALQAAHDAGVVHRDLKPANIKFKTDDTVKVLDFGLAKAMARETSPPENSPTLIPGATQAGVLMGTAAYMSPEQARARAVDQRTDLWSFGCVLYELLTQRQAFGGDSVSDSIAHVLNREIDWSLLPPERPPSIRRLLRRCLERDVRQRQQSAADARLEIEDALTGRVDRAEDGDATRTRGPIRSTMVPWVVAGTAGAAALAA